MEHLARWLRTMADWFWPRAESLSRDKESSMRDEESSVRIEELSTTSTITPEPEQPPEPPTLSVPPGLSDREFLIASCFYAAAPVVLRAPLAALDEEAARAWFRDTLLIFDAERDLQRRRAREAQLASFQADLDRFHRHGPSHRREGLCLSLMAVSLGLDPSVVLTPGRTNGRRAPAAEAARGPS